MYFVLFLFISLCRNLEQLVGLTKDAGKGNSPTHKQRTNDSPTIIGFFVSWNMQSNQKLIEDAIRDKWLTSLAILYFIKLKYKNSTIYNYSSRELAHKLNISHVSANKHIRLLQNKGLIKIYGNNLTFIKTNLKYKFTLLLTKKSTINEIKKELQFKIAESNFNRQQYIINKKNEARHIGDRVKDENYRITKKEYNKLNSPETKLRLGSSINNDIILSDKSLAKLLNTSTTYVTGLKKHWQNTSRISFTTGYQRLCKYYRGMELKVNQFLHKGYIYQSNATQYLLAGSYGKIKTNNK